MAFMKEFEHLQIQLEDIKSATDNFDKSKVIGHGGFGHVYKGALSDSMGRRSMVAFKRLNRNLGQGGPEFWKEIMMLSRYKHQNLISLLGFCNKGVEMILVYEYAANGSLDRHLSNTSLTWSQRIKICLDAARGLCYLHDANGTQQRVIHRDIKSSNILLDDRWNAKVADLGLAKIGPANQDHSYVFTNGAGTPGYWDPQYITTYALTKESDIYSFGVVLFEVLCGRLCYDTSNGQFKVLVPMWKDSYQHKKLAHIIFHGVTQPRNPTSLETISDIAYKCLHESLEERPQMSLIVETLETALKFQEFKVPKEYEKIVEAAVDHPLVCRSIQELKELLSKGLFLNEGKTWFSLNDKGQHCVLISIDQCLDSYHKDRIDYTFQYSLDYNSRFQVGTLNTCDGYFHTPVSSQFLSPGIKYRMNLVFKCPDLFKKKHIRKQEYIAITYILNWEKRSAIVHIGDKREDEWLVAGLYQFTTTNNHTNNTIVDFQIMFEDHEYWEGGLEIEGIEFQPLENVYELGHDDQAHLNQYHEILAAAVPPLIYRSIKELKLLLSKGVLLENGKTWFYLNDKGQHCEMISIAECLIPDATKDYDYWHNVCDCNSRFPSGSLHENTYENVRTRVRPQFLTPHITYTVNLVFGFDDEDYEKYNAEEQRQIHLQYKLDGETKNWISYLAHKREDNWWMVELFQITSYGTTVDIGIIFEGNQGYIVIEGIEFQPFENVEHQLLENKEDIQPISNSDLVDTYWEQKLPNDYNDIIKLSKDGVQWTTKKELYSIFCTGFLINNSVHRRRKMLFSIFTDNCEKWFFLDKNGKKCQMLSAKEAFGDNKTYLD